MRKESFVSRILVGTDVTMKQKAERLQAVIDMGGMRLQLLEISMAVAAAIVVMIVHELPKAILFLVTTRGEDQRRIRKHACMLYHYIDPIGLLLSVVSFAGFSKPLMLRVHSQKKNLAMGITGLLTLAVLFVTAVSYLKVSCHMQQMQVSAVGITKIAEQLFFIYLAVLSGSMFLVNLFPISIFDMGLLIAGVSARNYFNMIKSDTLVKGILIFAIAIGIIRFFSFESVKMLLAL